ncbi:serine/threonine-protein kinase [Streptomyces sp. NPDC048603]|uniref:serine/threonine-protein kinase n=1 Tax=Streptomyces sp. NPDC048603 TaxID=3365577 RepID=UPI0037169382
MDGTAEVFRPLQADDPGVVGGYRLAARLGAGGMGRVYLSHTQGGRPVAIKVVRPELAEDPDFRRRFRREVEAARRVRGAYTAELIDADTESPVPWLATLYVPGPSLADAVALRGPLPVAAVLWLVAGVAEALQAVHGAGIVHRDLKPSNVLLAADGPRVIDFGISLASGVSSHTATGAAIGTPQFMAPEQATAGAVTAATDVFALGQTAAYAALGKPLYGDGPHLSVLFRIVHDEPDLSALPSSLRPLFGLCLAADPADRATPGEIVEWCRKHLGGDPDAGGGPGVWREVMGPQVVVPGPVPDPTPVGTLTAGTLPQGPPAPTADRAAPSGSGPGRSRRRRTAVIAAVAVAAGALLLTGAALTVRDAVDRFRDRSTGPSQSTGQNAQPGGQTPRSGGSTALPGTAGDGKAGDGKAGDGKAGDGKGGRAQASSPAPAPSGPPRPVPYAVQWLDANTSVGIKEPVDREDRSGDIRFTCKSAHSVGCALESGTSRFAMHYLEESATLATCRAALDVADQLGQSPEEARTLPLAGAAVGSQICVRHPSGDIALLVVQGKSTATPAAAHVTVEMSVWRAS